MNSRPKTHINSPIGSVWGIKVEPKRPDSHAGCDGGYATKHEDSKNGDYIVLARGTNGPWLDVLTFLLAIQLQPSQWLDRE